MVDNTEDGIVRKLQRTEERVAEASHLLEELKETVKKLEEGDAIASEALDLYKDKRTNFLSLNSAYNSSKAQRLRDYSGISIAVLTGIAVFVKTQNVTSAALWGIVFLVFALVASQVSLHFVEEYNLEIINFIEMDYIHNRFNDRPQKGEKFQKPKIPPENWLSRNGPKVSALLFILGFLLTMLSLILAPK